MGKYHVNYSSWFWPLAGYFCSTGSWFGIAYVVCAYPSPIFVHFGLAYVVCRHRVDPSSTQKTFTENLFRLCFSSAVYTVPFTSHSCRLSNQSPRELSVNPCSLPLSQTTTVWSHFSFVDGAWATLWGLFTLLKLPNPIWPEPLDNFYVRRISLLLSAWSFIVVESVIEHDCWRVELD